MELVHHWSRRERKKFVQVAPRLIEIALKKREVELARDEFGWQSLISHLCGERLHVRHPLFRGLDLTPINRKSANPRHNGQRRLIHVCCTAFVECHL
jgi:hypothetical protein